MLRDVTEKSNLAGQSSQLMYMDICVQSVGWKKKWRVNGLGSLGLAIKALSKQFIRFIDRNWLDY